jgi:hypothetical protein
MIEEKVSVPEKKEDEFKPPFPPFLYLLSASFFRVIKYLFFESFPMK